MKDWNLNKKEKIMGIFDNLFNKTPSKDDISIQLKEVEREQKKKRRSLTIKEQEKDDLVRRAVSAKKNGKQEEVRDSFREIREIEIDKGYLSKDLHRISLTKVALKSMVRKMSLLERNKDQKSIGNLIKTFQNSKIQSMIDKAEIEEEAFSDVLEDMLGEEEDNLRIEKIKEDSGFADFDRALESMVQAEESGDNIEESLNKHREEVDEAIKKTKTSDTEY